MRRQQLDEKRGEEVLLSNYLGQVEDAYDDYQKKDEFLGENGALLKDGKEKKNEEPKQDCSKIYCGPEGDALNGTVAPRKKCPDKVKEEYPRHHPEKEAQAKLGVTAVDVDGRGASEKEEEMKQPSQKVESVVLLGVLAGRFADVDLVKVCSGAEIEAND